MTYASRSEKVDTIEMIIEKCSEAGLPALRHEIYVYVLDHWGAEWRKFLEYLKELVMRKIIVVDGEECWTIKRWEKIKSVRDKDYLKMVDLINA